MAWRGRPLFELDAGAPNHLAIAIGFGLDELGERVG
jgi:hypothetical protein